MTDPKPSFHPAPSRPKLKLPAGTCHAHVHVFGPHGNFPFAENGPFTPADAPKEKLFALHAMLGIEHCVIVQSTCHGFDNRVVADAIAAKNGDYCGVALLPPAWEDSIPFARTLVAEFGDRCFWGSDWPPPNLAAIPDDGVLVDLLSEIAPSEKQRKALLVDNPRSFYRFGR